MTRLGKNIFLKKSNDYGKVKEISISPRVRVTKQNVMEICGTNCSEKKGTKNKRAERGEGEAEGDGEVERWAVGECLTADDCRFHHHVYRN